VQFFLPGMKSNMKWICLIDLTQVALPTNFDLIQHLNQNCTYVYIYIYQLENYAEAELENLS